MAGHSRAIHHRNRGAIRNRRNQSENVMTELGRNQRQLLAILADNSGSMLQRDLVKEWQERNWSITVSIPRRAIQSLEVRGLVTRTHSHPIIVRLVK